MAKLKSLKVFLGLLAIFMVYPAIAQNNRQIQVDTSDIRVAAELIGLDFDQAELEQMSRGVSRQMSSLDQIRTFNIANSISPSLLFNPLPIGFSIPKDKGPLSWKIPDQVKLPDNNSDLAYYSIPELASLIKNQKISSEALTRFFINRIKEYNPELLDKERLLAITKCDMLDEELMNEMKEELPNVESVFISSVSGLGITQLKDMIWNKLSI